MANLTHHRPNAPNRVHRPSAARIEVMPRLVALQQTAGNQAIQRMLRSGDLSPRALLGLQSTLGNQVVQHLLNSQRNPDRQNAIALEGSPDHARSGPGPGVVQRDVTGSTQTKWRSNEPKKPGLFDRDKASKRKLVAIHKEIDDLISSLIRSPYDTTLHSKLEKRIKELLHDPIAAPLQTALLDVLDDVESGKLLTEAELAGLIKKQIASMSEQEKADLFPKDSDDLQGDDERKAELRRIILSAVATHVGRQTNRTVKGSARKNPEEIKQVIRTFIQSGLSGGQWCGRGLCIALASHTKGGVEKSVGPTKEIVWNHSFRDLGKGRFKDASWKQFFQPQDTAGLPPIFEGTPADFRDMFTKKFKDSKKAAPVGAIENYLNFIRIKQAEDSTTQSDTTSTPGGGNKEGMG